MSDPQTAPKDSASTTTCTRRPRIVVCATGSIAAIKVPELVEKLTQFADVRIACTKSAERFLPLEVMEKWRKTSGESDRLSIISSSVLERRVYFNDEDELDEYNDIGDEVVHIELAKWADLVIVSPLTANSLAKMAMGICDNFVLSLLRALHGRQVPVLLCPAMNTHMWTHPCTSTHISAVTAFGFVAVVWPGSTKKLACGDSGVGSMADVAEIVESVQKSLGERGFAV